MSLLSAGHLLVSKLEQSVEDSDRAASQSAAASGFSKGARSAERTAATEVSCLLNDGDF